MRTEKVMFDLILSVAKNDERVRAVVLNGSRTNPDVLRDKYQDYDVVFVVTDFDTFLADHSWIDVFGKRLMLQMPEAMRYPSGDGHFNWMMLLSDGNRIDLTLIPFKRRELVGNDSLSVTLLDKDGIIPTFPAASDRDYFVKPPSELFFFSCCNNFWWCLQNVAKGLARDELPYAMMMYHNIVRSELHDMVDWYIGVKNDFSASVGYMGKYYRRYLPDELYMLYVDTYSDNSPDKVWRSVFTMCDLFHAIALPVAEHFGFHYSQDDENGIREYLNKLRSDEYEYV
jgi:aminoglycoside 6-adenylyltransferase